METSIDPSVVARTLLAKVQQQVISLGDEVCADTSVLDWSPADVKGLINHVLDAVGSFAVKLKGARVDPHTAKELSDLVQPGRYRGTPLAVLADANPGTLTWVFGPRE